MVKNCLQNTQIMMDIMCGRYSTNRIFVSSYQPGLETLFAQSSSKKNTLPLVLDPAAISLDADTSDPEGSSLEETSANADFQALYTNDDTNKQDVRMIPDINVIHGKHLWKSYNGQQQLQTEGSREDEMASDFMDYMTAGVRDNIIQTITPKNHRFKNMSGKQISVLFRCCVEGCAKNDLYEYCK
ncbi:uncharacterized protein LOC132396322 isoform X2 [Hypanus sabinus]|nr:uncharacterized protein LOC132396322 isoform X2 [Hypanus sabinus]